MSCQWFHKNLSFLERSCKPGSMLSFRHEFLSYLPSPESTGRSLCDPHFVDEETEILRADVICLRSEWMCEGADPVFHVSNRQPTLYLYKTSSLTLNSVLPHSFIPVTAHISGEPFDLLSTIGHSPERWPRELPQICLKLNIYFLTPKMIFPF